VTARIDSTARRARLTPRPDPAVGTDTRVSVAGLILEAGQRTGTATRLRQTLVDVRLTLPSREARHADAAEAADQVAARAVVATGKRQAFVDVDLAASAGRAARTRTSERADQVATGTAVQTRLVLALVDLLVAERALEADVTQTAEVSRLVDARRTVATRHRRTLVDLGFTVASVVAERTVALVRAADVAACAAVDARQTCTTATPQSITHRRTTKYNANVDSTQVNSAWPSLRG